MTTRRIFLTLAAIPSLVLGAVCRLFGQEPPKPKAEIHLWRVDPITGEIDASQSDRPPLPEEWKDLYHDAARRAWDWRLKADQFRSEVGQLTHRLEMLESAGRHSDEIARKHVEYIRQLEEKLRAAGIALPPDPLAPPPGVKVMNRIRSATE